MNSLFRWWKNYHKLLAEKDRRIEELENLAYFHKGGEDNGYDGSTPPISWKSQYEEQQRHETWAMSEMKKACEKIKAHPEWKYGENAYPSSYERAIVAGCGQAVKELQEAITSKDNQIDISEQYRQFRKLLDKTRRYKEALEFYANPETYFAIGIFPDRPCGNFINDFSDTGTLGVKPGKRARQVLSKEIGV